MRDRATLYLKQLGGQAGGEGAINVTWDIPTKNLERSLRQYLENGADRAFDLVRQCAQAASKLRGSLTMLPACNSALTFCCH